jgi:hypothetical protein
MTFNLKRPRLAKKKFPEKGHKSQLPGIAVGLRILNNIVNVLLLPSE